MEVRDEFVADVSRYSGPLRDAAREADRFGERNATAALAARKMGLAAAEAADKAARAQRDAADAADKLARGELSVDEASKAAARAQREVERASIKAAEAQMATARAADAAAEKYRKNARAAELSSAAERLGALKAAGATQQYNSLLTRLKKEHGDLSKTAVAGFKMMKNEGNIAYRVLNSGSSKLGEANKLWTVGIANSLVLLPELASVAANAITFGVGGAIAGVGVLIAAKNKQVRGEYKALGHEIFTGLSKDAQPFVKTLDDIAKEGEKSFRSWEPEMRSIWAEMAPAVDDFVTEAIRSLDQFKPAFREITHAFNQQLATLGPALPGIMHNIATGLEAIAQASERNPRALTQLVNDLSLMIRYGGDAIGFLVRFRSEIGNLFPGGGPITGLLHFVDGIGKVTSGFEHLIGVGGKSQGVLTQWSGSADNAAASTDSMVTRTQHLLTAEQAATMTTNQLKAALDRLTGANQNAFDAETSYRTALKAATAQAKANNAGIDKNTKAANENRQSLSQLAQAIKGVETNGHATAAQIAEMRRRFIAAAEGMGVSKREAVQLANKLLGVRNAANKIPSHKRINVQARTADAEHQFRTFLAWANSQHIDVWAHVHDSGIGFGATGGRWDRRAGRFHYAGGGEVSGLVRGPGTGTSDSIPAPWLSNGEFVVNERQTKKHLGLLMAINRGVDGFAKGGKVDKAVGAGDWRDVLPAKGWTTPGYLLRADARLAYARARPEALAAMAAQSALAAMRRSALGGIAGGPLGAGPGSGPGQVVQYAPSVHVTVMGNVTTERQLVNAVQQGILLGRKQLTLPSGR